MNDREARLTLARLVEPGSWSVHRAVIERGAVAVAQALAAGRSLPGLGRRLVEGAAERAEGWSAVQERERLDAVGARLLVPGDDEWPEDLDWGVHNELGAPPLSLCVRGTGDLAGLTAHAAAVVGARASTPYGEHVGRELGLHLAERGCTVVSGGAYGIDAAAHRGAVLCPTGRSIAVLASGVDVAYPRGNSHLLSEVARCGLLVSEVLPGTHPTRLRFLVRNRLIAALSQGTVVVEAALRSGSLSTAHRAQDLGRHVLAVPGPVTSAMSAGCHELIKAHKAEVVTCAADVLTVISPMGTHLPIERRGEVRLRDDLSTVARQLLDALPVRAGIGEATIARTISLPVLVVQQLLPPLQIAGLIRRDDTGWVLTPLGFSGG